MENLSTREMDRLNNYETGNEFQSANVNTNNVVFASTYLLSAVSGWFSVYFALFKIEPRWIENFSKGVIQASATLHYRTAPWNTARKLS